MKTLESRVKENFTHGLVGGVNDHPRVASFTLVELLVVIAIIAILAALMAPAIKSARQTADSIACLSRLRQLALGMNFYAGENSSTFPYNWLSDPAPGRTWWSWYDPYLGPYLGRTGSQDYNAGKQLYYCPATIKAKLATSGSYAYAANWWVLTSSNVTAGSTTAIVPWPYNTTVGGNWSFRQDQWSKPANTPLLMCVRQAASFSTYPAIQPVSDSGWMAWDKDGFVEQLSLLHNGGCNFAFLDGHVSRVAPPPGATYSWYAANFNWMPDGY